MTDVANISPLCITILLLILIGSGVGIYLQSNVSPVGASNPTFIAPSSVNDTKEHTVMLSSHEMTIPSTLPTFVPIPLATQIPGSRFPHIELQDDYSAHTIQITSSFPFGKFGNATITVPVNSSVYRGATTADKNVILYTRVTDESLLRTYYLGFMGDPYQDSFLEALLWELREYRARWNLDNDSYLEFLTVFVQSIPYRVQDGGSRFPIETFVEYKGDCDDKALLLASLLAREGYNVSILHFKEDRHVALGIASSTMMYGTTGYTYLETTVPSLIGFPPWTINGGYPINSTPMVIPVSIGTIRYERGDQVARILADEEAAYHGIKAALPDITIERYDLMDRIKSGELENLYLSQNSGDEGFNSFQDDLATYCYIHSHLIDRQGTYEWVINGSPIENFLCS